MSPEHYKSPNPEQAQQPKLFNGVPLLRVLRVPTQKTRNKLPSPNIKKLAKYTLYVPPPAALLLWLALATRSPHGKSKQRQHVRPRKSPCTFAPYLAEWQKRKKQEAASSVIYDVYLLLPK